MKDLTFSSLTTVRANTKRGNMTTGFQQYLVDLKCTPLAPVDPETRKRLDLNTPHMVFETFLEGDPDIKKGDLLVIDSVEFPIRSAAPWPIPFLNDTRFHLVLEDLRM